MSYQNIQASLDDATKEQVIQKVREIEALLPFIVNLTLEEKRTLPKMGKKTLAFVERAMGYAQKERDLVPPYLDPLELNSDILLAKQLIDIMEVINPLAEKVSDTYHACGAEAYAAARVFYNSAKAASKGNLPGIDTIVKDLGERFKKSMSDKSTPVLVSESQSKTG